MIFLLQHHPDGTVVPVLNEEESLLLLPDIDAATAYRDEHLPEWLKVTAHSVESAVVEFGPG